MSLSENIDRAQPMSGLKTMDAHQSVHRGHTSTLVLSVMCCLFQATFGQNNLALARPAQQISEGQIDTGLANAAVDGIASGVFSDLSCCQTAGSTSNEWWSVDLQAVHTIKSVRITNRNDCCHTELTDFVVEVSVEDPSTLTGFPGRTDASICFLSDTFVPIPGPIGYACDEPVTGRYVRLIKMRSGALFLCEFEVFETNILTEKPNLAEGKPAFQSTTFPFGSSTKFEAGSAVDENHSPYLDNGTCSVTAYSDLMHWWMVDLEALYMIESISITPPVVLYNVPLSKFVVEISVQAPDTLSGFPDQTTAPVCLTQIEDVPFPGSFLFPCERPLLGRYVRLVKRVTEEGRQITMCDFEVFGEPRKLWRFETAADQGTRTAHVSSTARGHMMDCARLLARDGVNTSATPFFKVDVLTGACHFLQSNENACNTQNSNCMTYKFV